MINDGCGNSVATKNTGTDKQCLTKPTVGYAVAKSSQSFANLAAFRSKTAWDVDKQSKDIAILYSVERSELANVEATYYESRTLKVKTKAARKGIKFTHNLGYCSHGALESYEDSGYTHIYEFTLDGDIKGVLQDDGTVKGQEMSSFLVGILNEAIIEGDPQNSVVDIVYANPKALTNAGAIVTPDFNILKYKGIYPVKLTVVGSPSATSLAVRATYGCLDTPLTGATLTNFSVLKTDGSVNTPDSVTPGSGDDANLYTFVDTDLATGTIATNVIAQALAMYQTNVALAFTVS